MSDLKRQLWVLFKQYYANHRFSLVYFTSEQTVKRACDMLNSGEVEL